MKKQLLIIVLITLLFSCNSKNKLKIDVSNIPSDVKITRFEKVFYNSKPSDLPKIKKEFRFLFPHDIDSIWVKKMQDKDEQELFAETMRVYPNITEVKTQLDNLFKHVKYYYPKFEDPKTITLISNVDFEQKVVYADSLLFLSLDVFLGTDSKIYNDYPPYLKNNFTEKQLIVSTAKQIINSIVFPLKERTFISKMIQEGKRMYALDAFLPNFDDASKMGYSEEQLKWSQMNEDMIWSYFVEKELLYNTESSLTKRFLSESPFSKFYLDIDNESPGKIGTWLGWQIVRSYMKHNDKVSLTELMKTENDIVYKKSKYKPKR